MNVADAPYVGPRAFKPGETLYGRDRERRDLLDLLIADRIILLYSPSGAGKTSVIEAALRPQLGGEEFEVLPTVRVNEAPPEGLAVNRYLYSVAKSLEPELPCGLAEKAGSDGHALDDLIGSIPRIGRDRAARERDPRAPRARNVLVLDQFEEIFTLDAAGIDERRAFFEQLGEALRDPDLWALISMREDFIANLDPYASLIPTRLANRYRLELLGPEAAADAIRRPAVEEGVEFDADAATALVSNLRRIGTAADEAPRLGPSVEPVHLQIACLDLWTRMQAKWNGGARHIGLEDIGEGTDVDQALGNYYDAQLAAIGAAEAAEPAQKMLRERRIREWIERNLITPEGVRAQVLRNSSETAELNDRATGLAGEATVKRLVDAYLVRTVDRASATWYELSHDRLVNPIRRRNAEWVRANSSPFRSQAVLWRHGKDPELLFTGAALDNAEAWAALNADRLGRSEISFLEASREARRRIRREKRLRVVTAAALIGFLAVSILAAAFFGAWYRQLREANGSLDKVTAEKADLERKSAALERSYRARERSQKHYFELRDQVLRNRERERERQFKQREEQREARFRAREAGFHQRELQFAQAERINREEQQELLGTLGQIVAQRDAVRREASDAQTRERETREKLGAAMTFLASVQEAINNPEILARINALRQQFAALEPVNGDKPAQAQAPSGASPPSASPTPPPARPPASAPPPQQQQQQQQQPRPPAAPVTAQPGPVVASPAPRLPRVGSAPGARSSARPARSRVPAARPPDAVRAGPAAAAQVRGDNPWGMKLWANGSTLRVRFLNGEADLRRRVLAVAREWTEFANVRFVESDAPDAEVRVAFEGQGGFSVVGTDALQVPADQATVRLGGLAEADEHRFRQSVLHEFGHVLGLIHEDTNPNGNIPWNRATLDTLFDPTLVDENLVRHADLPRYRPFASESVMFLLSVDRYPATLFTSHFMIVRTDHLSEADIAFIRELYPPS